jgi:hypothetical protein
MNLIELATTVCTSVRAKDDDAVADCKMFLNNRYQMIWNGDLWRDSLYTWAGKLGAQSGDSVDLGNDWESNAEGYYLFPQIVARVLAIRTTGKTIDVAGVDRMFAVDPDAFLRTGTPMDYHGLSPALWVNSTSKSVRLFVTDNNDIGVQVTVRYVTLDGIRRTDTISIATKYPTVSSGLPIVPAIIEQVTKPTTSGNILVSAATGPFTITGYPTDTTLCPKARVRFLPKPSAAMTFEALVKKQAAPLTSDYDCPELRGVEQALMAFVEGDMLRRARRFNQANELYSEASTLLSALKSEATWQEETSVRLTPVGEPNYIQIKDSLAVL